MIKVILWCGPNAPKKNEQQTCRQLIAMSVLFDITGGMSYSALYDSDRKNQVYLILENKGKPNII